MKKILLIIAAALLLFSCATEHQLAVQTCVVDGCEISSIHNHMWY